MRTVVVYELMSLDGVVEGPDRFPTDWDDDELDALVASQNAVILGRRSYAEWAPFWPTSTFEPFASFINAVTKYVLTSTPLEAPWANSQTIDGDLVEFVRDLRNQEGGDIAVHASVSVAQALLAADLVDELQLVIVPAVVGSGRQLLEGLPTQRLETLSTATSAKGKLLVEYRVLHEHAAQD